MRTTKALSTISYNSTAYLFGVLDDLVKEGFLVFWAAIRHKAEEDENKDHWHVYMEPAKTVDTNFIHKRFTELDPAHPETPLRCLPLHSSKWVDWYWYGLHDSAYLASKSMTRKYHYEASQVLTSDVEYMAELVRMNPNPKAQAMQVLEWMAQGLTKAEIALRMNIPMTRWGYFFQGITLLRDSLPPNVTNRNGRPNHEPDALGELKDEDPSDF